MKRFNGTVVCIGTGPSLTLAQIETARRKGFHLFGVNLVYQIVPDLALMFATNQNFWGWYWGQPQGPQTHPCEKWTNDRWSAEQFKLHYIDSIERNGLSAEPTYLHHGHSSGACLVNLAYLMGAERIVLLGYDMKYAPDYDGTKKQIGSEARHYFGEYPNALQHWPKACVTAGVHWGLIEHYASIAKQNLVSIVNATPNSALDCFPCCHVEDC